MGKYSSYIKAPSESERRKREIHPIWRGIGFILAIAVPIFAYLTALMLVQENFNSRWFPIPTDLLSPWGPDPYIFLKLIIAVVIILLVSAVLMLITFVANALFGPPRYGPQDSPPLRHEEKPRYSRR